LPPASSDAGLRPLAAARTPSTNTPTGNSAQAAGKQGPSAALVAGAVIGALLALAV
jgi:hypothetical protein